MKVLRNPMNNNINDKSGFTVEPVCCPKALVNIPHMNERITNNNAEIIHPIMIPIHTFPTNCHPLMLLGSLKKSDWDAMTNMTKGVKDYCLQVIVSTLLIRFFTSCSSSLLREMTYNDSSSMKKNCPWYTVPVPNW